MEKDTKPIIKGLKIGSISLLAILAIIIGVWVLWSRVGIGLYNRLRNEWFKRPTKEEKVKEEEKTAETPEPKEEEKKEEGIQTEGKSEEIQFKYRIDIYFTNLEKEAEEKDGEIHVYPLKRGTNRDEVAAFSLSEMIKGPSEDEKAQGYYSEVVVEGVQTGEEPFNIRIVNKTAYVNFTKPLKFNSASSKERARMQIERTLTQFVTVDRVVITVLGQPL